MGAGNMTKLLFVTLWCSFGLLAGFFRSCAGDDDSSVTFTSRPPRGVRLSGVAPYVRDPIVRDLTPLDTDATSVLFDDQRSDSNIIGNTGKKGLSLLTLANLNKAKKILNLTQDFDIRHKDYSNNGYSPLNADGNGFRKYQSVNSKNTTDEVRDNISQRKKNSLLSDAMRFKSPRNEDTNSYELFKSNTETRIEDKMPSTSQIPLIETSDESGGANLSTTLVILIDMLADLMNAFEGENNSSTKWITIVQKLDNNFEKISTWLGENVFGGWNSTTEGEHAKRKPEARNGDDFDAGYEDIGDMFPDDVENEDYMSAPDEDEPSYFASENANYDPDLDGGVSYQQVRIPPIVQLPTIRHRPYARRTAPRPDNKRKAGAPLSYKRRSPKMNTAKRSGLASDLRNVNLSKLRMLIKRLITLYQAAISKQRPPPTHRPHRQPTRHISPLRRQLSERDSILDAKELQRNGGQTNEGEPMYAHKVRKSVGGDSTKVSRSYRTRGQVYPNDVRAWSMERERDPRSRRFKPNTIDTVAPETTGDERYQQQHEGDVRRYYGTRIDRHYRTPAARPQNAHTRSMNFEERINTESDSTHIDRRGSHYYGGNTRKKVGREDTRDSRHSKHEGESYSSFRDRYDHDDRHQPNSKTHINRQRVKDTLSDSHTRDHQNYQDNLRNSDAEWVQPESRGVSSKEKRRKENVREVPASPLPTSRYSYYHSNRYIRRPTYDQLGLESATRSVDASYRDVARNGNSEGTSSIIRSKSSASSSIPSYKTYNSAEDDTGDAGTSDGDRTVEHDEGHQAANVVSGTDNDGHIDLNIGNTDDEFDYDLSEFYDGLGDFLKPKTTKVTKSSVILPDHDVENMTVSSLR